MTPNLLVLGGATEARRLCDRLAATEIPATVSLAGRVANPATLAVPVRIGGFGGPTGLARYIRENRISHVVDATHPFAAQMSRNAISACAETDTRLIALTRSPWSSQAGDKWQHVPDIDGAVAALAGAPKRVFLAVGRMHMPDFAPNSQHFYLLRLVDPPEVSLPFPNHDVIVDRGPFSVQGDIELLRKYDIDVVVSKNSGGSGAVAKITAARELGLHVIMIDRPTLPARLETHEIDEVLRWIAHEGTERGV